MIDEELAKAKQAGDAARFAAYEKSAQLMRDLIRSPQFVEFLTVPAYQKILSEGS
jgi:malate synthase